MMQKGFSYALAFALFYGIMISEVESGPAAYGICQTGCNAVWVACCAAAGGTAGVVAPPAIASAIAACNAAQGVCMVACVAAGAAPTP